MSGAFTLHYVFKNHHIIAYSITSFFYVVEWILLYKHLFSPQGVNGSINGNSTSSVSGINTSVLSTTASSSVGQTKSISSGGGNRKCNQDQNKNQPLDAKADKIKDKVSYSLKDKFITDLYVAFQRSNHLCLWNNLLWVTKIYFCGYLFLWCGTNIMYLKN